MPTNANSTVTDGNCHNNTRIELSKHKIDRKFAKMPAKQLLNIDPDVLFQEHTISEIDDTQKKLLHEIERKREELRVMVGERYRDLIEAADTIGDMKSTAQNCIKHIEDMTLTCRNLHDTHLIGFKTDFTPPNVEKPIVSRQVHSIAIQIKILMAIPEQIWSNIDVEDFLTATQLYLFARHIYTGLQLETGGQSNNKNISALMPVVHRQWNSLSNFNNFLMEACQNKLGNADLKAEVAASCLASLLLLDNKKNLLDLMNTFIALHSTNSLSNILTSDMENNLGQGNVKNDIKDRIATSVKVIVRTVELLYSCFVENGDGLILQNLNTLFKKNSPPLINLVEFHDTLGLKLLPPIVAEFRLSPPFQLRPVSQTELSSCVSSWMTWVKQFTAERVESLLKYVNSAKSLHTIREDATNIDTPANWAIICRSLSIDQQKTNIWSSHFQPLLTKRLKDIVSVKWSDISKSLVDSVDRLLDDVSKPGCREKEANLNWFVWNDLIGQSTIHSREDIIKSINTLMKGMTMQDRGFTPNLEKLCENFNKKLGTMLADLKVYLYGASDKDASVGQSNIQFENDVKHFVLEKLEVKDADQSLKHSDCSDVEIYLRKCSMDNINSILEYIHKECFLKKNSEIHRKTSAILTARLLLALPQLVPNLRACFVPPQKHSSSIFEDVSAVDNAAAKSWDEVCKLLNQNCHLCWEKWIEITVKKVDELLLEMPKEFTIISNMDYLLVQWDSITIEEKDDQDQPISSTIKIPAGPSIKLQQFLYSTSRVLDEVIPHTLPKKMHILFIDSVAEKILKYFLNIVKDKSEEINQKCALQLLMDVRHLTLLLVTRENKKALADSHEVCDLLKQKIDPFDYDVFYPRLQTNAKRSVQRIQTLLGSLVPNHDQLNSIIGSKPLTSGGTADKEPNAYILAGQGNTSIAWFPLLPITAPLSARKQAEKQRKKQTTGTLVQSKSTPALSETLNSSPSSSSYNASNASNIVRSGAAAFFGSMTSDWFGGN